MKIKSNSSGINSNMQVRIFNFHETMVAVAEHRGPAALEYETAKKLIAWRKQNRVPPEGHATYGVHFTDPNTVAPADHRVDICVAYDKPIGSNVFGIIAKTLPGCRCAVARHLGSRKHNPVAEFLFAKWLPGSGESLGDHPMFFHYVNVGPNVSESEMITDVYLPLK